MLYQSLKGGTKKIGKFIYRNQRLKTGEIVESDTEPTDGKGNSLVDLTADELRRGHTPAFKLVGGGVPTPAPEPVINDMEEAAKLDPRTNSQIRRDIKEKYGEAPAPTMKKLNLIALETKLRMLHGKDAAIAASQLGKEIGMNDPMTLKDAEAIIK